MYTSLFLGVGLGGQGHIRLQFIYRINIMSALPSTRAKCVRFGYELTMIVICPANDEWSFTGSPVSLTNNKRPA